MGFIVKYSSEQGLISFGENVSDQRNAISTVSVTFAAIHFEKTYKAVSANVRVT